MFEADGKTSKKDSKNPNEKLRGRSIQGIVHISALVFEDGEYIDGKLYSVQDGNTYSLKAKLSFVDDLGEDKMKQEIESNYKRIKSDILNVVISEIERIKNDPNLQHLVQ